MKASEAVELSVVVPVFNSAVILPALLERLFKVLESLGCSFEIVMVDDNSRDGSWVVLEELSATYGRRLVLVRLMRNFGQHNALMCGFRHSRGALVATLDDDLQNPPEELPKLLERMAAGDLDVLYGVFREKRHARWRNVGSWLSGAFYRLIFRSRVHPTSFRVIRRPVLDGILGYGLNFTYIDGLLAWVSERIGAVEVAHHARATGGSGYSLGKLLVLALNLFTNFSLLPLQVLSVVGTVVALGGLGLGIYYLILYFLDEITVPGYASIITAVLVLGGLQLLALGVLGEYLGRLHMNVNRKPQYVVRTVLRGGGGGAEAEDDAA